jgi:hypothetical protein
MKQILISFAHDLDAFCARMNSGLMAVAAALAVLVAVLAVFRAEQFLPAVIEDMASGYTQLAVGQ